MTDTLAARSSRALRWSWAGALLRAVLQFVIQIAMARLLGPESFGQAAAALLVLGLAALVAEAGLASALVQRDRLGPQDCAVACGWLIMIALAVAALMALAAAPIAHALGEAALQPLVLASAAIVPLQAWTALPTAWLQRQFAARQLLVAQLGAYVGGYGVVGLTAAALGGGAWSLLMAFAAHAALFAFLAGRASAVSWWPRLGAPGAVPMLQYGLRTLLANLVNWALESVDRLWVSRNGGAASLGAYTAAATLARAPVTLLVGASQPVAFAAASRLQEQGDRLARGYLAVVALALLVAVPLFTWLAVFAQPLVMLLYGSAWSAAAAPFALLCLGVPFFVMLALTGPILRGVDAVGSETRAHAIVLLLLLIALWASLHWPWGETLVMVAVLFSAANVLRALALANALSRRIGLAPWTPWAAWRGGALLGVVVMVAALLFRALGLAPAAAALATAVATLVIAPLWLRVAAGALLAPPLRLALANRRGDSILAASLCRWARIAH